jgi:hypothetical protein
MLAYIKGTKAIHARGYNPGFGKERVSRMALMIAPAKEDTLIFLNTIMVPVVIFGFSLFVSVQTLIMQKSVASDNRRNISY